MSERRASPDSGDVGASYGELESQVRRLVKTEQRLFISQRDLSRQMGLLDALNRAALPLGASPDPETALMHAAELIFSTFPFDQCAAFLSAGRDSMRLVAVRAVRGREAKSRARGGLHDAPFPLEGAAITGPLIGSAGSIQQAAPGIHAMLDCLADIFAGDDAPPASMTPAMLLPIAEAKGDPLGYLVFRRVSGPISYHEELPSPAETPFLRLLSQQIAAALTQLGLVADLKLRNDMLAKAQQDLIVRERLAALGELAAVVAHEVRNPLAVIFNSLSLLTRHASRDAEVLGLVDIVSQEARHLNQIVCDLLDFARPTSPPFRAESLLEVANDALGAARAIVHPGALDARIETNGPIPDVRGDARMLHQIVINLVLNAHQASSPPGPIVVALSGPSDESRPFVTIEVIDRGPGIAWENMDRIFEPFFTTKATGSGLGLAVVRRFTELHDGTVSVRSDIGLGSTFTVRLPSLA